MSVRIVGNVTSAIWTKNKICDSCGKCIQMPEAEYYEIKIDEIMNTEGK